MALLVAIIFRLKIRLELKVKLVIKYALTTAKTLVSQMYFRPTMTMNCPAFIKNISFDLYSSQGLKVATSTGERLEWDGKDLNGNDLPSGVYYYYITVNFEKLDRAGLTKTFKGYVTLIR